MAEKKKMSLWKRISAYSAFVSFALVTTFFLTFPYDALRERVKQEADKAGLYVRMGSLGPGLLGLRATDVQVSKKAVGDQVPESVNIDSVSVGPSFFPPGLSVKAKLLGGSVSTRVSGMSTSRIKIDAEDLDLSRGNIKGFSGVDLGGTVEAHVDVTLPQDMSQATGSLKLESKGLTINGGTANLTIPQFGPEPAPIDLPKIVFGDVNGAITIDKGLATIDEFKTKSSDLEIAISGTTKLAKRIDYAEPNLEVRIKPDPEFQKRLGLVGSALSMIGADPKDPSWRMGKLTGYLGQPRFR